MIIVAISQKIIYAIRKDIKIYTSTLLGHQRILTKL